MDWSFCDVGGWTTGDAVASTWRVQVVERAEPSAVTAHVSVFLFN